MKRYILFFVSIGLILGIVLFYNTLNVENSKKEVFSDSGYILNSSSDRYYFYEDEVYSTSYDDKIVFYDTEGEKVTLSNANFIHYSSGNIVALQDSVLLDLGNINDDPIIYYNVSAGKEIKKTSNNYTVKNLDTDIQFEQAIWKLSSTKYIVLGNNITVVLNNGTTKQVEDYVEVEYFDNEIVNVYNQEFNYQTISSNSYLELENGITINLGTKIVSQDSSNKMALEDMTITEDDDVTVVDLKVASTDSQEETEEGEETENETDEDETISSTSTSTSTSTSSTTTSTSSYLATQNTSSEESTSTATSSSDSSSDLENAIISIEAADIIYEYVEDNESIVDETAALTEPVFKFENMEISAVGVSRNNTNNR